MPSPLTYLTSEFVCDDLDQLQFECQSIDDYRRQCPLFSALYSLSLLNGMEYTVIRVRGEFLHDQEMHMGPRSLLKTGKGQGGLMSLSPKSGYLIVTPFQLEGRE